MLLAAMLLLIANGAAVSATELITVPNDELLIARPGTRTEVARVDIDPAQVGQLCQLTVLSQNGASIHNGNDLIITTGAIETVISDVEAEANGSRDLSTEIQLGEVIFVELLMGPDWVSSLGFELSLDCASTAPVTNGPPDCSVDSGTNPSTNPEPTTPTTQTQTGDTVQSTDPCAPPVEVESNPTETTVPGPVDEEPICPTDPDALMTVVPVGCPDPTIPDTEPAPTTTAPEPEATTAPETTTAPQNSSDPEPEPEVLGQQIDRLPKAAPAVAVPKAPQYNG